MSLGETLATVAIALAIFGLGIGCLWGDLIDIKNSTRRLIDEALQIKYLLAVIAMEAREDEERQKETLGKAKAYSWRVRQHEEW